MQNSKKAKSWKTALLMVLAFFLVMAALAEKVCSSSARRTMPRCS